MYNDTENVLRTLYDEFVRTGRVDYCDAAALSNLPYNRVNFAIAKLKAAGYVKENVLGEVKLTELGISCFE